ncbi:hypothetical protein HN51_045541 [Arachis hypogaea]
MMETASISLLPLMPLLLSTPSFSHLSRTLQQLSSPFYSSRRITTSTKICYWQLHATTITMSTTTTTTITNNPSSRTSSVDTPSPIIIMITVPTHRETTSSKTALNRKLQQEEEKAPPAAVVEAQTQYTINTCW